MNTFFSTISFAQGMLAPLGTLCGVLEAHFIPPGDLRIGIMAFTAAIFAQLYSSLRKPSTNGGTVAPAATIDKALTIDAAGTPPAPGVPTVPANVRVTVDAVKKP